MATDPRLLQFQEANSLNLSITPGSVEKQGEMVGGNYRVGTGPLYVGKSSEESLFESLSMIAGGVVGTTSNLVQYQEAVDAGKRQKFLVDWESPDGPAAKIKDDPNLTDEEKVTKTQEWLEANVPNQNSNRVFGARVMKDWFDKNPLSNDIFDAKFAKFQEEAVTLSPDQRLELYDQQFKYFIGAELPSAVNARVTLLGQNTQHVTALNRATDNLVIQSQSSSFETVALAVLASKTGNQQGLSLLRENAKDPASKQELENQIELAEKYIETPTEDYLDAALFSGITGGPPDPQLEGGYQEERNQRARAEALRLHNSLMPKIIMEKAKWEESTQNTKLLQIRYTGLPTDPKVAASEVFAPILVNVSNNQSPEARNNVVGNIIGAVTTTAKQKNWSEDQTTTYLLDTLKETWKQGTPETRQWLVSSGLFGLEETRFTSIDGVFELNEYPKELEIETKNNLGFSLNQNEQFTSHLKEKAALTASGSEALPMTVTSPNQLPVFGDYFKNLITTNDPYSLRGPTIDREAYNKQVVAGFDDLGLGQELMNEATGPILWSSLGLPISDYRAWLAVQRNEDIDPELASTIESRYGKIRDINESIAYVQEKNKDPKWSAMNKAAKAELSKIYSFSKSIGDGSQGTMPGYFGTESAANTITSGVSTDPKTQNQAAFNFGTETQEGAYLTHKISQISSSLEYGRSVNGTLLPFDVPLGQKINGEFVPFPKETIDQVVGFISTRKKELQEQLRTGNITKIQYDAIMSRMGKASTRYAVGVLLDAEVSNNPELYFGSKPEKQQAQQALYQRWKESYLNLDEEFYYWSSGTDNPDLFYNGPSLISLYSGDNKLENIRFNATEAGLEDPEELKKWYRLSFAFSRGLYSEEKTRTELKKHFEVISTARDNGASIPDMLKTEEGKQAYYILMAYLSSVNERARANTLRNGSAYDSATFNIERNAILQKELTGGAETYIPAARWLSGFNLLTNSPDARTGAYKVKDPSGAYLSVTGEQLNNYEQSENERNASTAQAFRYMLSGGASVLNPKASVGVPGANGSVPSQSKLSEALFVFGTPIEVRARAEEGQEWDYDTRRDNILARVESVYYIPGSSPQQKFENLITMMATATGNFGTGDNQLLPYDANTGQFLMPEWGGRAEDEWWDNSRAGMVDDLDSLQSAGAGDPLLQYEMLAAQLSVTGGWGDFINGVSYNLNQYNRNGKVDLSKVLDEFQSVGYLFNQETGIPLVNYRQAVETSGINESVSGDVSVRLFYPKPENRQEVSGMLRAISLVPPAIFDTTGKEEVIKEGSIWDDTMIMPSVSGKESVGTLTYFFVPHRKPLNTEELTTFVSSELTDYGIDSRSEEIKQSITDIVSLIESRRQFSSDPIYNTNAYILHTISQVVPQYKLPSWLYADNQAILASTRSAHYRLDDNGMISQYAAIGLDPINENSSARSLGIRFRPDYFPIKSFEDRNYLASQFNWIKKLKNRNENLWGIVRNSYNTLSRGTE